jgi:catecholate siderophore receptor
MLSALAVHRFADGVTELRNQARAVHYGTRARETGASKVGTWDGSTFKTLSTSATGYDTTLPASQLWVLLGSHDRNIDDYGLYDQLDLATTLHAGGIAHTLLAGLDLSHDEYTNQGYARSNPAIGGATGVDVVPLVGATAVDAPPVNRTLGNLAQTHANGIGVYVNDTIELTPQWKLVAGLRRDRYAATISNSINSGNTAGSATLPGASQAVGFTSVRAGMIWQPTPRRSAYVSYGTSFDPSLETLTLTTGQQDLAPEKTRSVEAGAKIDVREGTLTLNAAVFRIEKDHARSQVSPGVYSVDGDVRVDGAEVGASGRLTASWQVMAGYTYLDGKVVRASTLDATRGNTLADTPRHAATLWTTWYATPQWEIGGGAVASAARWASNTDVGAAPGYVRFDGTVAWHQPDYDVRLNIFNLGDRRYIAALQPSDGGRSVPGAGRTVQLTGTWRF